MKKFLFYFAAGAVMSAGALIGVNAGPSMPPWMQSLNVPSLALLTVPCLSLVYFSARSIGQDMARGKCKAQDELDDGIHHVIRDDKQLVILARNISLPGEEEELYRLDEALGEDVFAIEVTREGGVVTIEPYRGETEKTPA